MVGALVGIGHMVVFFFLFRWLWRCCRQARGDDDAAAKAATATANEDQLQPKKSICTCYVLWLIAGPVGAHHYYLGRLVHGMVSTWTFNFGLCGWALDALLIPFYVRGFNRQLTHDKAPTDSSCRTLCIRLPLTLLSVFALIVGAICYTPRMLQMAGAVDIDRIAAQTQSNPYDILEVSRGTSLSEAKSAYRKASLKWHPDRNVGCGKKCEDKMSEITKAFELIKKRSGAASFSEGTWEDKFRDLGRDWQSVFLAFSGDK